MTESEPIQFKLTDELWEDMAALEGVDVASLVVWDSSLVDDDLDQPVADAQRVYVDFELYLANHTLLELYGAAVLRDEESDPMIGLDEIGEALSMLAGDGATLQEIAADQEDRLVLRLTNQTGDSLLTVVAAWLETTWEVLPEENL